MNKIILLFLSFQYVQQIKLIMPKIVVLFLLLISVQTKGQFTPAFNDTLLPFGIGSNNFDGICQDDSFYYVLGGTNNYDPVWGNMVLKLDRSFNVVSKRKYLDTLWERHDYPYNTVVVNENQIVHCPQITKNPNTPFTVYGQIIALNKNSLDTLWTKVIEHPDTAYVNLPNAIIFSDLTSIKETPDKGYILTGNYNLQCSGADKRSFLLKIDSLGNVEWRRTYNQFYTFFDIEIAADSGFFVPCTLNDLNMILVKFDKNGVYQWKTSINSNSNPSYPIDFTIQGNFGIVSSVFWYDVTNGDRALNVSKINLNMHTVIWERNYYLYKSIECIGLHQAIGVETLSDGSIIVNGTLEKYGSDKSAYILKLNSNGDSLWTKTYRFKNSNSTRSQLNDLLLCDDGGFLGVGYYSPSPGSNSSAWLFKTDANGVLGFESSRVESSRFKVFPNPAHDYTTLSYPCKFANLSYSIIDIQGKIIQTVPLTTSDDINTNEVLLNLTGLDKGTYQIIVKTSNLTLWSEKLVIN